MVRLPLEENSRSIMYLAPENGEYRAVFLGDATGDTMLYFLNDIVPELEKQNIYIKFMVNLDYLFRSSYMSV